MSNHRKKCSSAVQRCPSHHPNASSLLTGTKTLDPYVVIVFTEDNEVAFVPYSWLKSKTEVYWPPFRRPDAITKAVKESIPPDPSSWKLYSAKILAACATYAEGREKARRAEDTSDIQTDTEDLSRPRKRKAPEQFTYSEGSSSDSEYELDNSSPKKGKSLATKKKQSPVFCSLQSKLPPPPADLLQATPRAPVSHPKRPPPFPSLPTPERSEPSTPSPHFLPHSSPRNNFESGFEREVIVAISQIQVTLDALTKEMASLRRVMLKLTPASANDVLPAELPNFPLSTETDIDQLEEQLFGNVSLKNKLINSLTLVGGETAKETVRRVMKFLMTNSLSKTFNWAGKTGWKAQSTAMVKKAFGKLALSQVVVGAVIKQHSSTASTFVEKEIGTWLRNAGDREGGRKLREAAKVAQSSHM